jgi:hypothetical protein
MTWNHKPYWLSDTFIASTYSSSHLSQQVYFSVLGVYDLSESFHGPDLDVTLGLRILVLREHPCICFHSIQT